MAMMRPLSTISFAASRAPIRNAVAGELIAEFHCSRVISKGGTKNSEASGRALLTKMSSRSLDSLRPQLQRDTPPDSPRSSANKGILPFSDILSSCKEHSILG